MAKRKRSSAPTIETIPSPTVLPPNITAVAADMLPPMPPVRRSSTRKSAQYNPPKPASIEVNPDKNSDIKDSVEALRASPDADGKGEQHVVPKTTVVRSKRKVQPATPQSTGQETSADSSLSDLADVEDPAETALPSPKVAAKKSKTKVPKANETVEGQDPEADGDEEAANPEELQLALSRPPPVNSPYLPLPWKGRLGYACLNTYLRSANPPVFSSRTCRIASILEHRHPLKDPTQTEHATKNRPDKDQPADIARGQAYVEALGVANAKDISKMLRWNHKYGIRFFRLSSEMFPFASHEIYGYKLAPFAAEALAEAGRVAGELGHRLTTHPGQFTQLGSPREEVINNSFRDLEHHCELLDLLKLPPQQDRDAIMVLHMGGVFGDKTATIERFRHNYSKLAPRIKARLVLENDDVCYTVHDLLPVCEELNIPMVLDYHHHNILFDANQIREGTLDIISLYDRISATWSRKNITQKMHYSEPTPQAVTARQRRKHNPRVATLPPCPPTMDLMIEAKDKEQAVFELMRNFRLPGFETLSDLLPYTRADENRPWKPPTKKATPKKKKAAAADDDSSIVVEDPEPQPPAIVPEDDVSMGGPEGRVYWPPSMEEWLRPKKREVKPRDPAKALTLGEKAAAKRAEKAAWQAAREASAGPDVSAPASVNGIKVEPDHQEEEQVVDNPKSKVKPSSKTKAKPTTSKATATATPAKRKPKTVKAVLTPSTSDASDDGEIDRNEEDEDASMPDLTDDSEADVEPVPAPKLTKRMLSTVSRMSNGRAAPALDRRASGRTAKKARVVYADGGEEDEDDE